LNNSPSIGVVIPNWNGADHLPACLESLRRLDYPKDCLDVIVVDNGSTDSSRDLVRSRYPDVRLVSLETNVGFAEASNEGARASGADCVAFLNNDMRVDRDWLRELVAAYDPAGGYVCIAGVILDWDGSRIGFSRGWVNYLGHAGQDHYLEPADERLIQEGSELLFACGGSMLVGREVFLELGGFDPAYFALFEDVDFGWRLWLAGYRVRLAGKARCFHRHHATVQTIPAFRRDLLTERNALFTLIKNVSDENLATLLAPALLLLVKRAELKTASAREPFALESSDTGDRETVSRAGLARLHAVGDVLADFPELLERRRMVQSRRKRDDEEIFALFGRPFGPLLHDESYLQASADVRTGFGLDRLFTRQRVTRALIVADSDSDRLRELRRQVGLFADVTFLVSPGRRTDVLEELLEESDLVLAAASTVHGKLIAERASGLVVVDVSDTGGPELLARADVLLATSRDAQRPGVDDGRLVVEEEGSSETLRAILLEPWRWRRDTQGAAHISVPEDFQELLRIRRERGRSGGPARRRLRVVLDRLPSSVERSLRRVLHRPELTGSRR
jgi:GT2 family glycosyltransferase